MRLCLSFYINLKSGFQFDRAMVFPDDDLLEPALYQGLIKFSKVGTLLLDKILQVIDSLNLCVPGGRVNRTFLALLAELEDLVGNFIVGAQHPCWHTILLCKV